MVECLNCFKSLEYDRNGVAICPRCGEMYKCDVKKLYEKAGIDIDCTGCMGGG